MSAILARIPSSMTASVLTLRGVAKTFARGLARAARRTLALCEVDLDLAPGEIVALNGAEGAGKTTLLQCAAGLLRVDAGEVRWFGDAFPGGGIVPGVAFVPAVPVFYPFLTVRDVLAYRASRDGSPWEHAGGLIERAARSLDLSARASERVVLLTRAEVKRLAVAEALAFGPRAILLDTCTSDMSAAVCPITCRALESFAAAGGSVIIAVRDAASVASIATRLVLLEKGKIAPSFVRAYPIDAAMPVFPPGSRFVAERLH